MNTQSAFEENTATTDFVLWPLVWGAISKRRVVLPLLLVFAIISCSREPFGSAKSMPNIPANSVQIRDDADSVPKEIAYEIEYFWRLASSGKYQEIHERLAKRKTVFPTPDRGTSDTSDEPDTKEIGRLEDLTTSMRIPKAIYDGQWKLLRMETLELNEKAGKFKAIVARPSDDNLELLFYLKWETNKWKIDKVGFFDL